MFRHLEAFRKQMGIKEDEHIGNMWGWKVSFIGLGVLGFLIALYMYRVTYHRVPENQRTMDPTEQFK